MIKTVRRHLRASAHEVRCAECRVSWRSWVWRLVTLDRPARSRRGRSS